MISQSLGLGGGGFVSQLDPAAASFQRAGALLEKRTTCSKRSASKGSSKTGYWI
jgi:hypothetical protein